MADSFMPADEGMASRCYYVPGEWWGHVMSKTPHLKHTLGLITSNSDDENDSLHSNINNQL